MPKAPSTPAASAESAWKRSVAALNGGGAAVAGGLIASNDCRCGDRKKRRGESDKGYETGEHIERVWRVREVEGFKELREEQKTFHQGKSIWCKLLGLVANRRRLETLEKKFQ
ncbi:unnamed protein product [Somion occarium]|uniref:Uncharacterized protein n=1 Tax=Somion occarium TaxID=3059160 RepID=A0ABP1CW52_9APHY